MCFLCPCACSSAHVLTSLVLSRLARSQQGRRGCCPLRRPALRPARPACDRSLCPASPPWTDAHPPSGLLTDNSTSRFGRRRPALVVGVVMTAASTLLLGYTRHVASVFTPPHSPAVRLHTWPRSALTRNRMTRSPSLSPCWRYT